MFANCKVVRLNLIICVSRAIQGIELLLHPVEGQARPFLRKSKKNPMRQAFHHSQVVFDIVSAKGCVRANGRHTKIPFHRSSVRCTEEGRISVEEAVSDTVYLES